MKQIEIEILITLQESVAQGEILQKSFGYSCSWSLSKKAF